jgi:hypothetical protein
MFDRIRKTFSKPDKSDKAVSELPASMFPTGPVSEWAATQGFGFSVERDGQGMSLEGQVGGKPWRLQLGRPSRDYIFGQEVRARAELGIDESVAVLVINRPLKEALEKRAFQLYTDPLQTSVDRSLPEEMRWLSMFEEVGWDSLPMAFWSRLAVLSDRRDSAVAWLAPALAELMMSPPQPAPSAEVPFLLLLLNGKAYLRTEYTPADLVTLQHASQVFTSACEAAMDAFRPRG